MQKQKRMTLTIDDLLPALTKDMKGSKLNSDEPQKPVLMKDEP